MIKYQLENHKKNIDLAQINFYYHNLKASYPSYKKYIPFNPKKYEAYTLINPERKDKKAQEAVEIINNIKEHMIYDGLLLCFIVLSVALLFKKKEHIKLFFQPNYSPKIYQDNNKFKKGLKEGFYVFVLWVMYMSGLIFLGGMGGLLLHVSSEYDTKGILVILATTIVSGIICWFSFTFLSRNGRFHSL